MNNIEVASDHLDKALKNGTIDINKTECSLIAHCLKRTFPMVNGKALFDFSVLLVIIIRMVCEEKKPVLNGKELDLEDINQYFLHYGKIMAAEFETEDDFKRFYGAAMTIGLTVYQMTNGFANGYDDLLVERASGDLTDRVGNEML